MLDAPEDPRFARITRLATALLGVPVSLVSLVDADRQFFAASQGLPEPWASARQTPLSHSFCQHVVADEAPLVVTDARLDPRLADNLAIRDLDVVAYCGVPLTTAAGHVLGSFCVIDDEPRRWTTDELAVVRDLAGLVRSELALADLEAARDSGTDATQQVAALSHDIRGMLHAIAGGANTLARVEHMRDDQRRQLAGIVERQAEALRELVQLLLDSATAPDGTLRFDTEPVDVTALLVEVAEAYTVSAIDRVTWRVADDLKAHADPVQLRRCVHNLVDNALKHAGPGAHVTVSGRQDQDRMLLLVSDDGQGIAADELALVFERGRSGTGGAGGHGLGLHVVQRLVAAMGGTVEVTSTVGEGTTFTVALRAA